MPAKPQQMTDSQEKSDDLIAELAKLMASNAQGSESETKPTVIKLTPLSETTASPPPIRIPGMETPVVPVAPAVPSSAPTIRIPGMEKPAGVDMPAPAAEARTEATPQAAPASEPAKTPDAPPVPAPMSGWQRPAAVASPLVAKPAPQAPLAQEPAQASASRVEAKVAAAPMAAQSTTFVQPEPAKPAAADFDFDFGFGSSGDSGGDKGESSAKPEEHAIPATSRDHDPIADLIAAELDAAQAEPVPAEPAKPAPAAAPVYPASVEAVPARNFGNSTAGQAPVLVARPTGAAPRANPTPVAFKPLQPAPRPVESDKFAVAPVFGLGGRTSPSPTPQPAPAAPVSAPPARPSYAEDQGTYSRAPGMTDGKSGHEPDPMDEIESLIGEAVRGELSGAERPTVSAPSIQAQPQPHSSASATTAPVVPPLTTGFAPRRAGLKDNEPQVRSAEAAILAAAAATGAEVRINSAAGDGGPYKRSKIKPQKTNMFGGVRQYVGLAVAGTLLLAAGFGLYWVLGMGRADTDAPVLTADATPAKQAPATPVATTTEPARSVVFDEIDGVSAVDSDETLVSRDETADASVAEVARVVTPEGSATESGLANRKVRTVTVRPDGTIVSGDEAVAGTEALPVDRPNVPEVPGAQVEPSDLLTAAAVETAPAGGAETDPIAAGIAEGQAATAEAAPLDVAALAPTTTTPAVFDASLVAPVPMPRPVDRSALGSGNAPVQADTATATEPASLADLPLVDLNEPAPAASGATAAAYVQISSQPSEADAQAAVSTAQSRWGSLFNGNQLVIQRADLGAKGVKYRVRLPASSLQEATQICASIKAAGGDCFATNG